MKDLVSLKIVAVETGKTTFSVIITTLTKKKNASSKT